MNLDALAAQFDPILRWIILALAVPVLPWTVGGFFQFARRPGVVSGFRALAFLVAACAATANFSFLVGGTRGPDPRPQIILSLIFLAAALFVAIGGMWIFRHIRRRGMADLLEAVEVTGPLAELWALDPERARALALRARAETVDVLLDRKRGA